LIARKEPRRHSRVAARWLVRYLEEDNEATIDEIAFAASFLAALTGNSYPEAQCGVSPPDDYEDDPNRGIFLGTPADATRRTSPLVAALVDWRQ
jgi:hypothetical protein